MASLPYPLNRQYYHVRVGMAGMPYPPTDCRSYIKINMNTYLSNNSFYLLQLKGCHKQHLIAIYVFFIEESIDARLVWQNIGKKMSSYGAALTIA